MNSGGGVCVEKTQTTTNFASFIHIISFNNYHLLYHVNTNYQLLIIVNY